MTLDLKTALSSHSYRIQVRIQSILTASLGKYLLSVPNLLLYHEKHKLL